MTQATDITAKQIIDALSAKHADDLFVAECHDGPSGGRRLDAWVLKRTWSPWTTIGYEIKVTRQDFKRDRKWLDYLQLCHQFSFVCPAGLIQPSDLPDGIGLMWVSANKTVHTRVKAPRQEPDKQAVCQLMTYVLMSRTVIVGDMYEANAKQPTDTVDRRMTAYRKQVEEGNRRKELAEFIKGHVRQRLREMHARMDIAEQKTHEAEKLSAYLHGLGVEWELGRFRNHPYTTQQNIDRVLGIIDEAQLSRALEGAEQALKRARTSIDELKAERGITKVKIP